MKKPFAVVLVVIVSALAGYAQTDPTLDTGLKPYGSYHGGDLDSVSLTNGNLTMHISLGSYPQRGDLSYTPRIMYNNKGWYVVPNCNSVTGICSPYWAWHGAGVTVDMSPDDLIGVSWQPAYHGSFTYVFTASTADGSSHQLANNQAGGMTTLDGTAIWYDGSMPSNMLAGISRDRRGNRTSGGNLQDPNGNFFGGYPYSSSFTDTLGRNFPLVYTPGADSSGCTGPLPIAFAGTYSIPGFNGATRQIKVCYAAIALRSNFQTTGFYNDSEYSITERNYTSNQIQSVVLYNGSSWIGSPAWTFEYNSRGPGDSPSVNYGDLTKVTLPTGGTISYSWGMVDACDINSPTPMSRGVISRTVDANDGLGPRTWNYGNGHVTDPDGNETVHTFTALNNSCSLYETQTKYFQGSAQSGSLLKTVNTDYRWIPSPFDTLNPSSTLRTVTNVFPIRITTTWPNGKVTKIEKDYDSNLVFSVPGGAWTTASYGNVIELREYDYGDGVPGPLMRRTHYTYRAFDGSPSAATYRAFNLLDLVSVTTTYDGNGNQVAQTTSGYDETSLQPSLITAQHDTTLSNPGQRGNRTSESHWLNTTGGMVTSTASHYDTGTPYQITDPGGHVTTNFYDPGFQSGSNFAGAYVTKVQNALQQTTYFDYDLGTGLRTALKDANGQVSTWDYDFFNRTLHSHAPNQATTTWTYNDTQPPTFTASSTITSTLNRVSEADLDGLGRLVHAKLLSDPEGVDTTDTTYDKLGRVSTVSNPHRSSASATDGTTTSTYDALGRVTQITLQDGGISSTDYSQFPTVTVTDPAGKQRRRRSDALGRLVEVDEPHVGTIPAQNNYVTLQSNGNFVLYNSANAALWASGTSGTGIGPVEVQDDGNLVLYQFKWQAGTYRPWNGSTVPYDSCRVGDSLFVGQTLFQGQCLENTTNTTFALMDNGNLEIYDRQLGQITFQSFTWGNTGARLVMQGDGNLVIYSVNNVALWASGTYGSGANVATLENDGRLILYSTVWNTGTSHGQVSGSLAHPACDIGYAIGMTGVMGTGQCLVSRNGHFELLLQTDGNMVLYDLAQNPAAAFWSTGTAVNAFSPGMALQTLYSYDALGNLLCVEQHGDAATGTGCSAAPGNDATSPWRVRRFTYDSLGRLLTSSNPESNTVTPAPPASPFRVNTTYTYDVEGNLLQKTSPAPNQMGTATQTISYCYDGLHRMTGKAYSAQTCQNGQLPVGTAVVSFTYDQGTNGVGRMTGLTDQAGTGTYTYDLMGLISSETRVISGVSKSMSYDYNLDGSTKALHYPSGRIVNYTYNAAARPITAIDANGTQYVSNVTHWPSGDEYQRWMPNIYFNTTLNNRLQISGLYSDNGQTASYYMNKTYSYGTQNNGNVMSIVNNKDPNRTATYTYDALNRITAGWSSASTGVYSWGENYTIDAWGNLMISPMGGKAHGGNFQCAGDNSNRATCLGYDASGNVTANGSTAYSYDQENRLLSTAGTNYVYDADGNRVKKSSGSTGTLYWYALPGIIAETDLTGTLKSEYVFFGGKRIARIDSPGNSVHYYLSDHLNSTTMVVSSSGTHEEESDYAPFGSEYQVTSAGANHYKFTGKERDTETGLDYFGARYYFNPLGRFVTPDKPFADQHPANPQTWNLYTYVRNNPLRLVDDTGQGARPADDARINQYFGKPENTSILMAIQATNNYSIGAFESEMSKGANYLGPKLLGASGEAVMFNRLADSNPFGRVSFQPRIGDNDPDLKISFEPNMFSGRAALSNIVGQPGGVVPMDAGPATIYFEVKTGSDFSNLMKGAAQAAGTASALDPQSNTASVLVVDKGAYNNLTADQQQQLQIAAGGAYIQLQPNLNQDATGLAAKTRKEACRAASGKCK